MKDKNKTKNQLIAEVQKLREEIANSKKSNEEPGNGYGSWLHYMPAERPQGLFSTLADSTTAALFLFQDEQIVYVNAAAQWITGYTQAELVGMKFWEFIHPDFQQLVRQRGLARQEGKTITSRYEVKIVTKQREVKWIDFSGTVIQFNGKQAIMGTAIDVTDSKRIEVALERSKEEFKTLAENAPDIITRFDRELRHVYISPAIEKATGLKPKAFIGKTFEEVGMPKESTRFWREQLSQVFENKKPNEFEFDFPAPDRKRHYQCRIMPEFSETGEVDTILLITRDVTEHKQMEEELRKSEERYRSFVQNSGESIFLCEYEPPIPVDAPMPEQVEQSCQNGCVIECNDGFARMHGASKASDLIGMRLQDLRCAIPNRATIASLIQSNYQLMNAVTERVDPKGEKVYISNNFYGVVENGYWVRLWGSQEDITERKKAEETLRESEERFRLTFEYSLFAMALVDVKGTVLTTNPKFREMFGYSDEDLASMRFIELTHPDDVEAGKQKFKDLEDGKIDSYIREKRYITKSGQLLHGRLCVSMVRDPDGKSLYGVSMIEDITKQKRAAEALRESEENFRLLVTHSPDVIMKLDRQGKIVFMNYTVTDYKVEQALGTYIESYFPPEDAARYRQAIKEVFETQEARSLEVCSNNSKIDWYARLIPIKRKGLVETVMVISTDISERKRKDEAIRASERRLRALVGSIDEIVFEFDRNGTYLNIWTADEHLLARPAHELLGKRASEVLGEKFTRPFLEIFRRVLKTGKSEAVEYSMNIQGRQYWFLGRINPIPSENGPPETVSLLTRDITERRRAEEAARFTKFALDHSSEAAFWMGQDGQFIYVNDAACRSLGFKHDELLSKYVYEIEPNLQADGWPERWQAVKQKKSLIFESEHRTRKGQIFPVEIKANYLSFKGEDYICAFARDITERKRAEEALQNKSEQLRNLSSHLQSLREEERTRIAREIHDECGQSLTALKMDLSVLEKRLPKTNEKIEETIASMSHLIDSMMVTIQQVTAELRPGILDDFGLSAAIEWQSETFQKRTGIKCNLSLRPYEVKLDRDLSTMIFRIFQEALTNVVRHAHATQVDVCLCKEPGHLTLTIKDNGIGIKEHQISDTHSYGLIGMRERVHPWGGQVEIKGSADVGTSVTLNLPLDDSNRPVQ